MKRAVKSVGKARTKRPARETLTEAYEVRAFRDEMDEIVLAETAIPEITHAAPGAFEDIKRMVRGHGEQAVLPDDCQFGDNDLCYIDA
ncbi:MAG: hypothetical protein M0042_09130 [Nitrospiraceae bacterium]|nr:hypothetical protein [Nitrospiraceae bacterium]